MSSLHTVCSIWHHFCICKTLVLIHNTSNQNILRTRSQFCKIWPVFSYRHSFIESEAKILWKLVKRNGRHVLRHLPSQYRSNPESWRTPVAKFCLEKLKLMYSDREEYGYVFLSYLHFTNEWSERQLRGTSRFWNAARGQGCISLMPSPAAPHPVPTESLVTYFLFSWAYFNLSE